jgi:hypothetical protein
MNIKLFLIFFFFNIVFTKVKKKTKINNNLVALHNKNKEKKDLSIIIKNIKYIFSLLPFFIFIYFFEKKKTKFIKNFRSTTFLQFFFKKNKNINQNLSNLIIKKNDSPKKSFFYKLDEMFESLVKKRKDIQERIQNLFHCQSEYQSVTLSEDRKNAIIVALKNQYPSLKEESILSFLKDENDWSYVIKYYSNNPEDCFNFKYFNIQVNNTNLINYPTLSLIFEEIMSPKTIKNENFHYFLLIPVVAEFISTIQSGGLITDNMLQRLIASESLIDGYFESEIKKKKDPTEKLHIYLFQKLIKVFIFTFKIKDIRQAYGDIYQKTIKKYSKKFQIKNKDIHDIQEKIDKKIEKKIKNLTEIYNKIYQNIEAKNLENSCSDIVNRLQNIYSDSKYNQVYDLELLKIYMEKNSITEQDVSQIYLTNMIKIDLSKYLQHIKQLKENIFENLNLSKEDEIYIIYMILFDKKTIQLEENQKFINEKFSYLRKEINKITNQNQLQLLKDEVVIFTILNGNNLREKKYLMKLLEHESCNNINPYIYFMEILPNLGSIELIPQGSLLETLSNINNYKGSLIDEVLLKAIEKAFLENIVSRIANVTPLTYEIILLLLCNGVLSN